jgi:predicted HicB family RNase H-like nuclease
MRKPEEYGVSVRLVQDGQDYLYEARVTELPDVRTYGETFSEAYSGAVAVIAATQKIFAEKGKAFPDVEPHEDEFSGRVTLRMSKSLHRCVHEKASRDGVSLNQWIVEAIASRSDKRMVPADSVLVASQGRLAAGDTRMTFLQTQHLATIHMDTKVVNIFAVPGVHEAMTKVSPIIGSPRAVGRITNG